MAKKAARKGGTLTVSNLVVEQFLIDLAVDDAFRKRFSEADEQGQRAILANEYQIGDDSITALLSGEPGRVKARLRVSDQQGTAPLKAKAPKKR